MFKLWVLHSLCEMEGHGDVPEGVNAFQLVVFFQGVEQCLLVSQEAVGLEVVVHPKFVAALHHAHSLLFEETTHPSQETVLETSLLVLHVELNVVLPHL